MFYELILLLSDRIFIQIPFGKIPPTAVTKPRHMLKPRRKVNLRTGKKTPYNCTVRIGRAETESGEAIEDKWIIKEETKQRREARRKKYAA